MASARVVYWLSAGEAITYERAAHEAGWQTHRRRRLLPESYDDKPYYDVTKFKPL